ncbi:MAG: radical SAM protein [Actinomycetota bacterium]|nr:radical SAM protein [Actinomycetota bacterium]
MSITEPLKEKAARTKTKGALSLIRYTPEGVLIPISDFLLRDVNYPEGKDFLQTSLLLARNHLEEMSPSVQESILNFFSNMLVKGERKRGKFKEAIGFAPPVLIVISPTMRCNLSCYGCYAGKYSRKNDLGLGTLERLIAEAEEMGIYFMVISGGEPFILGDEFLDILGRHPSILFQIYTNGTLIDEHTARKLSEIGNAYPCISVEGFEKETDERRGKGTFEKIMKAMDTLRENGDLFGFSATATRQNNELIVSERFIDFYRKKGCVIGWYFHYVPVGKEPGIELMPTPEQRIFRREELIKRRAKHDILLADFWNDGPMVGGCIAGGRSYLHINSNGEVEPCVFAHFAVDNVKDKSLTQILRSPFFTEIRKRQPYSENLLRPCMIIDSPEVLREVVTICGAHPTHPGAEAVIEDLAGELDEYSSEYKVLADELWKRTKDSAS